MGRIARLKRITKARIEAFLDSLERPAEILPQLEKEMAAKVTEAANAEAKAASAVAGAQRKVDEATGRAMRLEKGAHLAMQANDMETCRRAVGAVIETEKEIERFNAAVASAQAAYESARRVRRQLQENLEDLRHRKKELIKRDREARLSKRAIKQYDSSVTTNASDILETVARMEAKVEEAEAEVEVKNDIASTLNMTLKDAKIAGAIDEAEVEDRMATMRSQLSESKQPD